MLTVRDRGVSGFTAKVGKSIDIVATFDAYAIRTLEGMKNRQQQIPTLSEKIISLLGPFSAFEASNTRREKELRDVFLSTSTRILGKIKLLLANSFELGHDLLSIKQTLDRIKELAIDEVGDTPQLDVLRALWIRLARANDYKRYKSHGSLLADITDFYHSSADMMAETVVALNRMEAELIEFRNDFATPGLILEEQPLEVSIDLLRKSMDRLESGRMRLEKIERGERVVRPVKATATIIS